MCPSIILSIIANNEWDIAQWIILVQIIVFSTMRNNLAGITYMVCTFLWACWVCFLPCQNEAQHRASYWVSKSSNISIFFACCHWWLSALEVRDTSVFIALIVQEWNNFYVHFYVIFLIFQNLASPTLDNLTFKVSSVCTSLSVISCGEVWMGECYLLFCNAHVFF